jgi:20S proteasome alpha/beta subunit
LHNAWHRENQKEKGDWNVNYKMLVPPLGPAPKLRIIGSPISMSILIGIICPEAIVVAADSHATEKGMGTYSSVAKISVVEFWPGEEVLVAQAGLWSLTNRIIDTLRKKAVGTRITSAETVTKLLEDSIRESKMPLDKEQRDYVTKNPPALMLAFYIGKAPCLYTVEVYGHGISVSASNHFATTGIGAYLANYLLGEFAEPKAHSDVAIATSIFVIKKVKENTKFCGGDTKIRRIVPMYGFIDLDKQYMGKSELIPQDFVNLAEKRILKMDEQTKKSRDKKVFQILRKTGSELWQKHIKRVQAEQGQS